MAEVKCTRCKCMRLVETEFNKNRRGVNLKTCKSCAERHKCDKCDYRCCLKGALKQHIKIVHDKIKDVACDKCEYKCSINSTLKLHIIAVHDKIKDFACDKCDYKCSTKGNLERHINTVHDKIKDVACDKCEYKCSSKCHLKRHIIAVHDKIKDFECGQCNFKCSANGSLNKHIKICTGKTNMSHGEYLCLGILTSMNIKNIREMRFPDCKDKSYLPFDFYLPDDMVCIELDGLQHFEPVRFGGSEEQAVERFKNTQRRDEIKNQYCESKGIELLRIPYTDFGMMELIIDAFLS